MLQINMYQIWNINDCSKNSTDSRSESYRIPTELVLYYLGDSSLKEISQEIQFPFRPTFVVHLQRFYSIKYCYLHNRFLENVHKEMITTKLIDYTTDPHIRYVDNTNITYPFRKPYYIMFNVSIGEYAGHEDIFRIHLS